MDNAYSDAVESLLHDHCTPAVVRGIEAGADASALWTLLHESGFADCLLPEAALTLHDVFPMLRVMGQYVLPVPLAQTMFARAVLHAAGAQIPDGPIALASVDGQARVPVADGATAQWFLIQHGAEARLCGATPLTYGQPVCMAISRSAWRRGRHPRHRLRSQPSRLPWRPARCARWAPHCTPRNWPARWRTRSR